MLMDWLQRFFTAFADRFVEMIRIGGHDIAESILELLDFSGVFTITLGGFQIPITKAVINLLITVLLMPLIAILLAKGREMRPGRLQAGVESLIGMLENLCRSSGLNEAQTREYAPFAGGLFMYILVSNLLSVFSLEPAAVNPAFPIAMAFFDIICIIIWGIHFVGLKGFFKSLVSPMGFMLPFNLLDYIIKPISLAFRLFGNIFGASILIAFLKAVVPLFLPQILGLWFDIGDGIIQAIVFMYLSINYVGEIVEKGEAHANPEDKAELQKTPAGETPA